MAVGNVVFLKFVIVVFCIAFTSICATEDGVDSKKVLEHVSRNILKASSDYGLQIRYCNNIISTNQSPKIDKRSLSDLGITREDAVTAIAFLQFRNYFLCEQEARLKLAFHLGTMESLKKELGLEIKPIENIQSTVSYPSEKELILEIKYLALSEEIRSYFESVLGNEPFDLMTTLEVNRLLR